MKVKWAEKLIKGAVTSEDVLGKDVIDSKGLVIGVSDRLYLNPHTLDVLGISVDKGFLQKGFVISKNYIKNVTTHAVFLTIQPSILLKGKPVFDKNGEKVGKVCWVELVNQSNSMSALIVKRGLFGFRKVRIPKEYVETKERGIFLNIDKSELKKNSLFKIRPD